jgi:hypothetical protein
MERLSSMAIGSFRAPRVGSSWVKYRDDPPATTPTPSYAQSFAPSIGLSKFTVMPTVMNSDVPSISPSAVLSTTTTGMPSDLPGHYSTPIVTSVSASLSLQSETPAPTTSGTAANLLGYYDSFDLCA